jgi:DNA gyrase subunit A
MDKYKFTEPQAKAIVDMKLGRLAGLEKMELNQEKADLDKTIDELDALINQPDRQKEELINRLRSFVKKYGDARRTEVTHIDIKPEEKEIAEVVPEDAVVVVTQSGLVKRVPATAFKVQKKGGKGVKSQDDTILDVISTNTIDTLMFFTTAGKMYRTVVDNVPNGTNATKGVPMSTLINLQNGERVIGVTSLHRATTPKFIIFITKNGMVKKSYLEEYFKTNRNTGIAALNVKEGDEVVDIIFQDEEDLVLITKLGMSIRFDTKSIGAIGRVAMGVKGIKLADDDEVVAALPVHKETDQVAVFTETGLGKKVALNEFPVQGRGGKGTYVYKPTAQTGNLVSAAMVSDEDNILLCGNYSSICISATEIPLIGKTGMGNTLIKNNRVMSVLKL